MIYSIVLRLVVIIFFVGISFNIMAHSVPKGSSAFIISPNNNQEVASPFTVKFGITGFKIAPVGVNKHKAGHYHLLIDVIKAVSMDEPIPRDNQHIHFDQGETQTTLNLSPGKHTLQVIVGDEEHEPFEGLISKPITIYVNNK